MSVSEAGQAQDWQSGMSKQGGHHLGPANHGYVGSGSQCG